MEGGSEPDQYLKKKSKDISSFALLSSPTFAKDTIAICSEEWKMNRDQGKGKNNKTREEERKQA